LHYCSKANEYYQQLEQGRKPAISGRSFDSPEANRSEYDDAQSAEQSRDHRLFPRLQSNLDQPADGRITTTIQAAANAMRR
jgi:hypothetical protein